MARRRDFVRGAHAIAQKRLTTWFQFVPAEINLSSANSAVLVFSLNAAALALRPFTIVRTRFVWHMFSDQGAANESQQMAAGIAVVSDEATAVGVTAVPTPMSSLGSDLWFVHEILLDRFQLVTAAGFTSPTGRFTTIDSKAMRKVDVGQDVVVVLQNGATSEGTSSVIGGRMLVKVN